MVDYSALTDTSAVDAAIAECDRIGRAAFLQKHGFGEATTYFLVTDDGSYDSKAIFGVAYGIQHGVALGNDDFHGGKNAAAGRLSERGYVIEGLDAEAGRTYFESLEAALDDYRLPVENRARVGEFAMEWLWFRAPRQRYLRALLTRPAFQIRGTAPVTAKACLAEAPPLAD